MKIETGIPLNDWRAVAAAAQRAEQLGFDGVLSFEIANEPFMPLAFAALATERVSLGTAIAVAFPRSPMVVANTAWDLNVQSKGRFTLGLGTQVKGHNERRFSVPWSAPLPRMREYVQALRAIWRCWENGEKLDFTGEHYNFTLMTPEFSPPPSGLPQVPVTIAAVRPAMLRMAGQVCDGVRLHGFATRRYIDKVAMPALVEGLEKGGRARDKFEIWGGGFISTGPDEEAVAKQREWVRYRVGFYGSTRSYLPVLETHGWEELGAKLNGMARAGQWKEMPAEIPDEVLDEFTVSATWKDLAPAVEQRFGGVSDSITLEAPAAGAGLDGEFGELLTDLKRIPSPFSPT
jgi:probable F420-dependent oxidoreductase